MICKICGLDINKKCQDNVSPISGYPVCEDCIDDLCCNKCFSSSHLYYCEDDDKIYCRNCVLKFFDIDDILTNLIIVRRDNYGF